MNKLQKYVYGLTAVNYAMMLFYSIPKLLKAADWQVMFDLRFYGYSTQDAINYLAELNGEERLFYIEVQQMLDTFFPALLALSLIITLYRLAPKLPALFLTPLAGALFDYYENATVRQILLSEFPDPALVEMASLLTSLKFASIALSLMAILWLWRRGKA